MEMFFPRCHSTLVNLKVGFFLLVFTTLQLFKTGSTLQCNTCEEGWYVKRNCSITKEGLLLAALCSACQRCDAVAVTIQFQGCQQVQNNSQAMAGYSPTLFVVNGEGQTMLVNCTKWSNTVCQKVVTTSKVVSTFASTVTSATETTMSPPLERVWLLAAVLALLGAVFIALTMTVWFGACVSYKPGGKLPNTAGNII